MNLGESFQHGVDLDLRAMLHILRRGRSCPRLDEVHCLLAGGQISLDAIECLASRYVFLKSHIVR